MSPSNEHSQRIQIYRRRETHECRGIQFHHHEIHALFEEFIHRPWGAVHWSPAVDVWEEPDRFLIRMDLPGVPQADIQMRTEKRTLVIEGERHLGHSAAEAAAHLHERPEGRFIRAFEFDFDLEDLDIDTTWQDGVLTIVVPKAKDES
jgi:HSP20 family protein